MTLRFYIDISNLENSVEKQGKKHFNEEIKGRPRYIIENTVSNNVLPIWMVKKIMRNQAVRFILVGIFNTISGIFTMFCFYNFLRWGYWGSSASSYTLGSIISFFLNKSFTFKNHDSYLYTGIKFAVNIGICYFIAYLIAKPLVRYLLLAMDYSFSINIVEQLAMMVGMVLFTGLNFFGQKLYVFGQKGEHNYGE